jgi:hypothetical protein
MCTGKIGHTARTVAKEDLALASRGVGIRRKIGLTNLKVGFYINVGSFLQVAKIIIRELVEGDNVVPCSLGLCPS